MNEFQDRVEIFGFGSWQLCILVRAGKCEVMLLQRGLLPAVTSRENAVPMGSALRLQNVGHLRVDLRLQHSK